MDQNWKRQKQINGSHFQLGIFCFRRHVIISLLIGVSCSISMPVVACQVSAESVQVLSFGDVVSAKKGRRAAWVRVNLDGTVQTSRLGMNIDARQAARRPGLGLLRLSVSGAEPGGVVAVKLRSRSSEIQFYPVGEVRFRLPTGESSGDFFLEYGGHLQIQPLQAGKIVEDLDVLLRCIPSSAK